MHTFYLQDSLWTTNTLSLEKTEAHHLSRVLRLRIGEEVLVMNGLGKEALCTITTIGKNSADLTILEIKEYPPSTRRVTLAAGWGKAARRGFILEKCVELEAHAIWFWQAERSQFPLPSDIKTGWQEQLIAGAKQCKNPYLPKLETKTGVKDIIEATKDFQHKQLLVESEYAHEKFMSESELAQEGDTICVVGPEGGFSPQEIRLFQEAGFKTLSMGDRILRWETAALMALGLHWWKKQEHQ